MKKSTKFHLDSWNTFNDLLQNVADAVNVNILHISIYLEEYIGNVLTTRKMVIS